MRKLILASLVLGLAAPLAATELQLARVQPSVDLGGQDQRMAELAPSLRAWVNTRARTAVDSGVAPDPALIAHDAEQRLAGQDFSSGDIEAVVQLVMMESARQAEDELREAMSEMQSNNERKADLREMMKSRRAASAAARTAPPAPSPESQAICVDPPCRPQLTLAQPRIELAKSGAVAVPQTEAPTDSLSDSSEMTSLRLQMAMDRRSKFMEALSNLMKKNSDTASTITSNLK